MTVLNSVIGAMIIIDKNATTVIMNFLIYITYYKYSSLSQLKIQFLK
ncbi:hypothetical protein EIH00_10660, partial [Staphylococcus aureus]